MASTRDRRLPVRARTSGFHPRSVETRSGRSGWPARQEAPPRQACFCLFGPDRLKTAKTFGLTVPVAARYLCRARNGWLCRTFVCSPNGTVPPMQSGTSVRQCRPFVEERHDPRSRDVAGFQPVEPKARFGKQIVDLAVEMTPARQPQPERIEAILPAGDTRLRRASMLHEQ